MRVELRDSGKGALGAAHDEQIVVAESDAHAGHALSVRWVHFGQGYPDRGRRSPMRPGVGVCCANGGRDAPGSRLAVTVDPWRSLRAGSMVVAAASPAQGWRQNI